MAAERIAALMIYSFSALAFLYLLLLWIRSGDRRRVYGVVYAVSTVWFGMNVVLEFSAGPVFPLLILSFAFPPLLLALFRKQGGWQWLAAASAVPMLVGCAAWFGLGALHTANTRRPLGFALGVFLTLAAAGALRTLAAQKTGAQFRSHAWLLAAAVILVPAGFVWSGSWWNTLARSLPTAFLFVGTFYQQRFRFYDIFVKRGLFILACAALLAVHQLLLPGRYWTLLPLVAILPRIFRWIEAWVDRFLLHRRFGSAAAASFFLRGLDAAENEAELEREAANRIREIFRANSSIRDGILIIGEREQNAPILSEDQALLAGLQDSYTLVRSNLRLREARRDQQLAAIRARVNPHFLFNALNSIADLTHRDPARAEQTVEQLAEVFRHSLKASEREWITLREEIRSTQAYLDVERARFEDRLEIQVDVNPSVEHVLVPSMIVQTLVENAVKHGTSKVNQGRLRIEAWPSPEGTRLRVSDNGPGLAQVKSTITNGHASDPSTFGLRAIRERLEHHYGGRASLELIRQEGEELTLAEVLLPERKQP